MECSSHSLRTKSTESKSTLLPLTGRSSAMLGICLIATTIFMKAPVSNLLGGRVALSVLRGAYRDHHVTEQRLLQKVFHSLLVSVRRRSNVDLPRRSSSRRLLDQQIAYLISRLLFAIIFAQLRRFLVKLLLCQRREQFWFSVNQRFTFCPAPILNLFFSIISIGYSVIFFTINKFNR